MRFHLVYSGPLRASANTPKPLDVMNIRREFSPQLGNLWETHHALQVLRKTGARQTTSDIFVTNASPRQMAVSNPKQFEDCLVPIEVGDREYQPLVRKSLDLNCELQILFLRQQDPGELVSQGGDIDNRVKTLLDALRVPSKAEQDRAAPAEHG